MQPDWLIRAWNYYFIKDGGAAASAARKAQEQDSDNPLAYVGMGGSIPMAAALQQRFPEALILQELAFRQELADG